MEQSDAKRRLLKDFQKMKRDPPPGISASPHDGDIFVWDCVIFGVDDTIWADAVLKLQLLFSEEYPQKAPYAKFITYVFHPNVFQPSGEICIDTLRKQWSPAFDVTTILLSIQSLLDDPNPYANANPEACQLFMHNKPLYETKVKECVEKTWEE